MERMQLDFVGSVAVLKFNHPQVMNAVGAQMLADLAESILQIKDPSNGARCLLLKCAAGLCSSAAYRRACSSQVQQILFTAPIHSS